MKKPKVTTEAQVINVEEVISTDELIPDFSFFYEISQLIQMPDEGEIFLQAQD